MKHRIIAILGLAALFVMIAPKSSEATDGKWYAGHQCKASTPSQAEDLDYYSGGVIRNLSASSRSVLCPVVHDLSGSYAGTVWVKDQNYSSNFQCQWWHRVPGGSYDYDSVYTSGNSPYVQDIDWSDTPNTLTDAYAYVWCSIPGVYSGNHSTLYSYFLREQ